MMKLAGLKLSYDYPSSVIAAQGQWRLDTAFNEAMIYHNTSQHFGSKLDALEKAADVIATAIAAEKESEEHEQHRHGA